MPRKRRNPLGIPSVRPPWGVKHRGAPGSGGDASVETGEPSYTSFLRLPNWMRAALQLRGDKVASQIENPNVKQVIDAFQNGWGVGEFPSFTTNLAGAVGLTNITNLAINPDVTRRIIAYSLTHTGGAASLDIVTSIVQLVAGAAFAVAEYAVTAVAVGSTVGFAEISQGTPFIVPPGWEFRTTVPALAGGELVSVRGVAIEFGAGFNPL